MTVGGRGLEPSRSGAPGSWRCRDLPRCLRWSAPPGRLRGLCSLAPLAGRGCISVNMSHQLFADLSQHRKQTQMGQSGIPKQMTGLRASAAWRCPCDPATQCPLRLEYTPPHPKALCCLVGTRGSPASRLPWGPWPGGAPGSSGGATQGFAGSDPAPRSPLARAPPPPPHPWESSTCEGHGHPWPFH